MGLVKSIKSVAKKFISGGKALPAPKPLSPMLRKPVTVPITRVAKLPQKTAFAVKGVVKAAKGGKTMGLLRTAGKFAKVAGTAGAIVTGLSLVEKGAEKLGVRGGAGFIGRRPVSTGRGKKRGRIGFKRSDIKALKRVERTAKIVNRIIGKTFVGRRNRRQSRSEGVITKGEALRALRR